MRHDRLSALIQRFSLRVQLCESGTGNMRVLGSVKDDAPTRVIFSPTGRAVPEPVGEKVLIEANVDWGGAANPLLVALPSTLAMPVTDKETVQLLHVFLAEAAGARCGSDSALNRLAEVLVIRILRAQIEKGTAEPGLVAGLANHKISRAIVAMHDTPGRAWNNEELAQTAGMSLSRFCGVFRSIVGQTPQAYLRGWRMTLARQDLDKGARVGAVAHRYGYASPEALARAFQRQYGMSPSDLKRGSRRID